MKIFSAPTEGRFYETITEGRFKLKRTSVMKLSSMGSTCIATIVGVAWIRQGSQSKPTASDFSFSWAGHQGKRVRPALIFNLAFKTKNKEKSRIINR